MQSNPDFSTVDEEWQYLFAKEIHQALVNRKRWSGVISSAHTLCVCKPIQMPFCWGAVTDLSGLRNQLWGRDWKTPDYACNDHHYNSHFALDMRHVVSYSLKRDMEGTFTQEWRMTCAILKGQFGEHPATYRAGHVTASSPSRHNTSLWCDYF